MGEMIGKFNIIITNIHYALGTTIPLMVEITIFNQTGAEQFKILIPASMCRGHLEKNQELVLAPKDQISISNVD